GFAIKLYGFVAEISPEGRFFFQTVQRDFEREWQRQIGLARYVTDCNRAWVDLVRQSVMQSGQNTREREIWIGIRTRRAMLDAARNTGAHWDAQPGGAVVHAPAAVDRCEHVGLEPAVGIDRGREQRHRRRHQRLHAADSMAELFRSLGRAVIEDVVA